MKILDIGCWGGKKVMELRELGHEAYGIDITDKHFPKELELYLDKQDICEPMVQFHGDFDQVLMSDVLEHVEYDGLALKNANDLLKKGGLIIFSTPRSIPLFEWYDPAWIKWKLGRGKHKHYKKQELITLLESAGFAVVKIERVGNLRWLFCRWINGFGNMLGLGQPFNIKKTKGYFHWEVEAVKV